MKRNKKNIKPVLLQPGYLVVGEIQLTGCTSYTIDSRKEKTTGDKHDADWHTKKKVESVTEQKGVRNTRGALSKKLRNLGAHVAGFGYLVPLTGQSELEATLREIEREATDYNKSAKRTRIDPMLAVFQVSSNNERVALALYKRTSELLGQVSEAIKTGNVRELRRQIRRLTGLDRVLPLDTGEKVSKAMKDARKAARQAVKKAKNLKGDAAVKAMKKALKGVAVEAVRADMIEMTEKVAKKVKKKPMLAPVDARQVE